MPRRKRQPTQQVTMAPVAQPNNNVMYIVLAVLVVFLGYMFIKVMSLEKQLKSGATTANQQDTSPLTVDKLKQYAKDLGMNTGKFNKCLDSDAKKEAVTAQETYGTSVGVQGTPGFFINGRFLAGAFPYQFFKEIIDKELAGNGSANCADYSKDLQQYCSDPQNKAFDPVAKQLDVTDAQATGPSNAKIQLVEFSDFECPYCIRAYPTVEQIMKDYQGQVRLYYKQFPLTQIHPHAEKTAEASLCAADQGKFWEFYHKVFGLEQSGQ